MGVILRLSCRSLMCFSTAASRLASEFSMAEPDELVEAAGLPDGFGVPATAAPNTSVETSTAAIAFIGFSVGKAFQTFNHGGRCDEAGQMRNGSCRCAYKDRHIGQGDAWAAGRRALDADRQGRRA